MKAVIFDFDGVILDSEPQHYASFFELFKRLGIPCSETADTITGRTSRDNIARVLKKAGVPCELKDVERLSGMRDGIFLELILKEPKLLPGARALLEALRRDGVKVAVASSSNRKIFDALLPRLGLDGFFDAVVSGDEVTTGKPDQEIFLKAAKAVGATPSQCVVIEDSNAGVQAAKAAGIKVLMVFNPYTKQQKEKADAFVRTLEAVTPEFLEKL